MGVLGDKGFPPFDTSNRLLLIMRWIQSRILPMKPFIWYYPQFILMLSEKHAFQCIEGLPSIFDSQREC
jgi:hypothetical protein